MGRDGSGALPLGIHGYACRGHRSPKFGPRDRWEAPHHSPETLMAPGFAGFGLIKSSSQEVVRII
jgi:hypothetical protein